MKLVHPDLQQQLLFQNQTACQWVIESPALFAAYVQELYKQTEGEEGRFVLSEDNVELDIAKYMELIVNPFAVNLNDKKILHKLYAELTALAYGEELYLATQEMSGQLQTYFFQLEQSSTYILDHNTEFDVSAILKAIGVQFENDAENFFEEIILYLKVMAELMGKKVVALVHSGSYLSNEQLRQLLETAGYLEISILLIETQQKTFSDEVISYIIDCDRCEI